MTTQFLYDHPLYYDILFGWDRSPEADFYESAFRSCGIGSTERLLEVACGPGGVGRRLARRGWTVVGIDNRESMVAYLRDQSIAEGAPVEARCADMASFASDEVFGGGFNPLSSFRLLQSDELASTHLASMAACIRPGGVYVLDLTFESPDAPNVTTDESWSMSRGSITVRAGNESISVEEPAGSRTLAWGDEIHLRKLSFRQFEACVRTAGGFEIESLHPESGRSPDGVSLWRIDQRIDAAGFERAMVVMRRL